MELVGEVAFARMDQRLAEFLWNAVQRGAITLRNEQGLADYAGARGHPA